MSKIYEPFPFEQDLHGCEVAVCQQTAHLLNGEMLSYEAVSLQLNRKPQEYVDATEKLLWLLRRDYKIDCKGSFDESRAQLEGANYIREFYHNDPTLEDILATPDAANSFIRNQEERALLNPFLKSGQYTEIKGTNTVSDIAHTLALGGLVHTTMNNGTHSVVIYDTKRFSDTLPMYDVYNPHDPHQQNGLAIFTKLPHHYMESDNAFDCDVFHITKS